MGFEAKAYIRRFVRIEHCSEVAKMAKKVIVYSTRTCPWCVKAKEFLTSKKVKFEDVKVDEDRAKAEEMIEKSGQMGVPVIDIDGTIIVGFDREAIERALAK